MPTGWRPADVAEKFPIKIEGVHERKKYNPYASNFLKGWSWMQLIVNSLLMYFLLAEIGEFGVKEVTLYSIFLFVSIFAYTTLMDRHVLAVPTELIKLGIGVWIIYQTGGWLSLIHI